MRIDKSRPAFLALSAIGFIASAPALAQDAAPAEDGAAELQGVTVESTAIEDGVKVERVESPKATAPLLDTPQTITVIGNQVLRKQNLLTLRDALQTIPGITFGAGEGGGGYGDSINLRGYSANNDITQDGVRDSAQYNRTETFNLQQIEVYNGANSVFNGSGSVGGTINLVSKVPQADNLTVLSAGIGTDNYYRATVDTNIRASDFIAVRLNGVYHRNDVPGRDFEKNKRWGIAPSVTLGIASPTRLTLSYLHQRDDNVPVFGVPFFRNEINDGPLPGVSDRRYFGYRNLDAQDITVDRATATFEHDFSDGLRIRNLSRWQRIGQDTRTSAPQGTFCLANGLQPVTAVPGGTVGAACPAGLAAGQYQPSGPRGLSRAQENQLLYNQTDLTVVSGEEGGTRNTLNIGAAFTWEDYAIETASLARNPNGSAVSPLPILDLSNPSGIYTGPINYTVTARSRSETRNQAIYAFDTLEIGPMFELSAGLRYEWNQATFRNVALASYPPGTTPLTPLQLTPQRSREKLFSYRFGAVFHPIETVSLYASYGNSKVPSSATVRLGCGVLSAPGAADPCAVAPETARNYEIGAKADVLGGGLQLSAALFRNERSNFRVASNDPAQPASLQVLDGRSRVDGLALGATGNITENWSLFANYTYLKGKVLQGTSDFCIDNPGAAGCANSPANPDPQRNSVIFQTPKHSGSLFTTYQLPFGLQIGYGLTYQGSFALNNPNVNQPRQFRSDDYLIHRAFLSYAFDNGITAQLNVTNFTNERYFTGIRNNVGANGVVSGGWATPGEDRSAVLTIFYSF